MTPPGSMPWTAEETRLVTAWICSPVSCVPGVRSSSTEAVGLAWSVTKTWSLGMARCTIAVRTPWMASSVFCSSPSIARW